MMSTWKRILMITTGIVLLGSLLVGYVLLRTPAVQDRLFERLLDNSIARQMAQAGQTFHGLRVFMCGTASPLPTRNRAQACVAVVAGKRIYLVDAGAGSAGVFRASGLPMQNLRAIFLTHYHSDHIAGLYDFNLNSWVAGRSRPLQLTGPVGIENVTHGLNRLYRLDRVYRVTHHGSALLDPTLGILRAVEIEAGLVLDEDGLKITAFAVNHEPVSPAFGYRFDYLGRSVVISGDAVANDALAEAAKGADILFQDALSLPLVQMMEKAMAKAGNKRLETIFRDIQDYHADTFSLASLMESAQVRQLALYHLVPPPDNFLARSIFRRRLPEHSVITEDRMWFELPANSEEIHIR